MHVPILRQAGPTHTSKLGYSDGKSIRLKHVCVLGSATDPAIFSIVNLRGPSDPWRSRKPLTGVRLVPVANCDWERAESASVVDDHATRNADDWHGSLTCSSLERFSMGQVRTACQNHLTLWSSFS